MDLGVERLMPHELVPGRMTPDPLVPPSQLTRIPQKWALYRREVYYRESFDDLAAAAREAGLEIGAVLSTAAMLVVKPDGLAHGVLPQILEFLEESGFVLAGWRKVALGGKIWRELWRYQLTCATSDRLAINDMLYEEPGILLALRHPETRSLPATVLLGRLKGSATLECQHASSLRARLGQPSRMLSLFHVADEPADLIRELGILLEDAEERRSWFRGVAEAHGLRRERLRAEIEAAVGPPRPGGLPSPQETLMAAAEVLCNAPSTPEVCTLRALISGTRVGDALSWATVRLLWERADVGLDRWTVLVLGTTHVQPDEPGERKILENPPTGAWND